MLKLVPENPDHGYAVAERAGNALGMTNPYNA